MPANHPKQDAFDEEINLRDLVTTLGRSKWLVLGITLTFIAAATVYVTVSTPVYKAQAITVAPTLTDLASYNLANNILDLPPTLNNGAGDLTTIASNDPRGASSPMAIAATDLTPSSAYSVFLSTLQSAALRQSFFDKIYLPTNNNKSDGNAHIDQLQAALNQDLVIQSSGTNSTGPTTITWKGTNPQQISKWLNQYVDMALNATHDQLVATLNAAAKARTQQLDRDIQLLRVLASAERQHKIDQLQDALKVAKSVQITKPLSAGNLVASYEGTATYLRGSEALEAEINQLKSRTNDDAYLPQLPALLYARHLLQTTHIAPDPLSAATVIEAATAPSSPIKPRKKLVIAMGAALGLMLGVLTALIRGKLQAK